ncbi:MAG: tRNA lysidine(34) synthetase TilS [Candidatus Saccharibacteria bacterium]|nr:tRNA lysidine(34) synthetase TilS [Candidatus Saccharibacteria bacterium]
MKYVVAVSGGVDSVALLDMLVRAGQHSLIVAHFDHGIRPESVEDARFVAGMAARYGLPFVSERAELGANTSEATARQQRYDFLFRVAAERDARVVTAHHQDDVIETIALNIMRGTRWRGVAVMGDTRLARPLIGWTKQRLYDYALQRRLEWVDDATNYMDVYMRNRLRRRLAQLSPHNKKALMTLYYQQAALQQRIHQVAADMAGPELNRYMLTNIPSFVAEELLYQSVKQVTGVSLLTAQLQQLLIAIKVARAGTEHYPAKYVRVKLARRTGIIERVD